MFRVLDNCGKLVKEFPTWIDADHYRNLMGRPDWTIKAPVTRKSSYRQQDAVRFCEDILGIAFTGNIANSNDCSAYLSMYLSKAKAMKAKQDEEEELPDWLVDDLCGDAEDAHCAW